MTRKKLLLFFLVLTVGLSVFNYTHKGISSGQVSEKCATKNNDGRPDAKSQCWENMINSALKEEGLDSAFDVLADLYSGEPEFVRDCHSYTHKLGEAAYRKFVNHEDMVLTAKTSYCGYGFYHGFMEALLFSGGKIEEARRFCAYAGEALAGQTSDAEGACYHGIGHGTVDGGDPTAWGNPGKMVEPGLEMCEKVADTETKKNRCASGVFNSLAIMFSDPKYKLNEPKPYEICTNQSMPYFKKACYEEMNTLILRLNDYDVVKASGMVGDIKDSDYAATAMQTLAGYAASFAETKKMDTHDIVKICHSVRNDLSMPCIIGFGGGLMEFGTPGTEYDRALDLCGSGELNNEERKICFGRVLWLASVLYPAEKHIKVCGMVKEEFRSNCP